MAKIDARYLAEAAAFLKSQQYSALCSSLRHTLELEQHLIRQEAEKGLAVYVYDPEDYINSAFEAGLIDQEQAIKLQQQKNLSPEKEFELQKTKDKMRVDLDKEEMLYATQAIAERVTGQLYGRCKVRSNDRSRAVQKAKAVAKRHKKNKNKKTHRK